MRRRTIDQWFSVGVPFRNAAAVDRIANLTIDLNRLFKTQRLPTIAREKLTGLDMRTMLEVLRTEGTDPMYEFLRGLHGLVPGADPTGSKAPTNENK